MNLSESAFAILFLGPPGAGKGTQAHILAGSLRLPHLSIGDLLRACALQESKIGLRLRHWLSSGELVPEPLVFELLAKRMDEPDCSRGVVLDGFPRTLLQAKMLERLLESPFYKGGLRNNLIAIQLCVRHDTIANRLSGRRVCPHCNAVYNIEGQSPRVAGVCDFDGSPLTKRSDDSVGTILRRLQLYEREIAPVIRHYARKARLFELDGDQPKEDVARHIDKLVRSKVNRSFGSTDSTV